MPGATPAIKLAYAAALVGTLAYVIGFTRQLVAARTNV